MTWTLRLYDGSDVEIAWVRADPFEWKITHPDGTAAWQSVNDHIYYHIDAKQRVGGNPEAITEEGRLYSSKFVYHGETPKEHLEWVRDGMVGFKGVTSAILEDE
jgi:hypothetical protein